MKVIASVLLIVAVIFAPIFNSDQLTDSNEMITEWADLNSSLHDTTWEVDEYTRLSIEMNEKIAKIPYDINNDAEKMDWFIEYKNIVNQYPKELHNKTIYEEYSSEELDLLFRIVQCETGDEYGFIEKANVISVIFNRHTTRGLTLTEVLTAKNQFAPYSIGVYKNAKIDEKTILACEFVYMFGDTTDGCMAFRSDICPNTWYSWTYQFSDKAHHFYK